MATKTKKVWFCGECGHKEHKWLGQCPSCRGWNTLAEEVEVSTETVKFESQSLTPNKPVRINEVKADATPRIRTQIGEVDRLLGGGIVPGSLSLIGGDPGIGKSTLMLQLSNALARQGLTVLYICGEESVAQTSLRARRLGIQTDNILLLSESNFSVIKSQMDAVRPDVVIVDSIQIIYKGDISSSPGSVTQVREAATEFMYIAKGQNIAIFLIGHVTKTGEIAGPRVLEHIVDTVLYFEGDKQHNFRMIRVVKNRFGACDEVAVFQMNEGGLSEVPNPSQIFLEERRKGIVGSVIIPTLEGTRPILVEVQALVTDTAFSTPSRRCTGLDQNRLLLLLAVLEKRMGYPLYQCDVFVSAAGGIKAHEPAADLGLLMAVASSLRNKRVDPEAIIMGEVGLGGEVRSIPRVESRLKEAIHMGFQRCVMPKRCIAGIPDSIASKIKLEGVEMVEEAVNVIIV